MRAHHGEMFYTADDIDLERVHAAMSEAGRRTRPLPLRWLGNVGHRLMLQARPAHDYGPHRPEDAPVAAPIRIKMRDAGWVTVPPATDNQRYRINRIAHEQALAAFHGGAR